MLKMAIVMPNEFMQAIMSTTGYLTHELQRNALYLPLSKTIICWSEWHNCDMHYRGGCSCLHITGDRPLKGTKWGNRQLCRTLANSRQHGNTSFSGVLQYGKPTACSNGDGWSGYVTRSMDELRKPGLAILYLKAGLMAVLECHDWRLEVISAICDTEPVRRWHNVNVKEMSTAIICGDLYYPYWPGSIAYPAQIACLYVWPLSPI